MSKPVIGLDKVVECLTLDQYLEYVDEVVEKVEAMEAKNFYSKVPKKALVNRIDKIVKEVIN